MPVSPKAPLFPLAARHAALGIAAFVLTASSAQALTLTDIRGRSVELAGPVERIAIDDGRFLVALSLIHPDPVGLLAAWPGDVNRLGEDAYAAFLDRFPELAEVPRIPSSAQAFDVESVLATAPQAVVVSDGAGPSAEQVAILESAGISVLFIDFFVSPLDNIEPSLSILGALSGSDERTRAYLDFRAAHLDRVRARVSGLAEPERPTVFVEAHAGISRDCCNSVGPGNVGDYIAFVGGRNIGTDVLGQAVGQLSLEYVIDRDPDFYIATGGPHLARSGGLVLGSDFSPLEALESLERVAARPGIGALSAVADGAAYGFSHQLINSPLDVIAIEVFAKWLHPALFADLDPEATLAELNDRFLAVPYGGTYWIGPAGDPG